MERLAQGELAAALGVPTATTIPVQPLDEIPTPESVGETVEQVMERALDQRADLQAEAAGVRSANAETKQVRAAFYPDLKFQAGHVAGS
jgi:outer membrane protein TolC